MKLGKKQIIIGAGIALIILVISFFASGNLGVNNSPVSTIAPIESAEPTDIADNDIDNIIEPVATQTPVQMTAKPTNLSTMTPTALPTLEPSTDKKAVEEPVNIQPIQSESSKENKVPNIEVESDKKLECTISIVCKTILDNKDRFDKNKMSILPQDGVIMSAKTVEFNEGENVFNILKRETKRNKIHMEFSSSPLYNTYYIEGIGNIYEFDCGELSGWTYSVNGEFLGYGSSQYSVKDGDVIQWVYTCDLGRDVGNIYYEKQK